MVTVQPKGDAPRRLAGLEHIGTPEHTVSATSMAGTPWDDLVTFAFLGAVHMRWILDLSSALARGVSRIRLESGEIMLEAPVGELCRVEWDVRDHRDGTLYQESATGFVEVTQASIARFEEAYTMTLYRGDFYVDRTTGERVYWSTP